MDIIREKRREADVVVGKAKQNRAGNRSRRGQRGRSQLAVYQNFFGVWYR